MTSLETICRAFGVIPADMKVGTDEELRALVRGMAAAGNVLATDFIAAHGKEFVVADHRVVIPPLPMGVLTLPRVRNLVYHVCALKSNNGWKDNLVQLNKRMAVFNGRRIIGVARGPGIHDPSVVIKEIPGCEYLVLPNCKVLREVATFLPLMLSVANDSAEECSFYAHTKSNSTADDQRGAWAWTKTMYHHLLDFPDEVMKDLRTNLAVGTTQGIWHGANAPFPTKLNWAGWAFFGTFWWFRHDAVFSRPKWMCFPNDRYVAEAWLGNMLPPERCKSRFQPWPLHQYPTPCPYDESLYPVLPNA